MSAKSPMGNMVERFDVTWVSGRIDPTATRVVITTPTASIVPTVKNGVFAAWWPGNDGDLTTITAYGADGTVLAVADGLNCPSPRLHIAGHAAIGGCLG
jgi:hypothetical protein